MKRIAFLCLLPVVIAAAALWSVRERIDGHFFAEHPHTDRSSEWRYIESFNEDPVFERQFFGEKASDEKIYLLGSSELTGGTDAKPYNFIPDRYDVDFLAVGHAGNQCFSIFSQLLAHHDKLNGKRIVIVLSPGWFQSHFAEGTSSSLFLEYNSPRFLERIRRTCPKDAFRAWEAKRIAEFYNEITGPHLDLKLLAFEHQGSKSAVHKVFYAPVEAADKGLKQLNRQRTPHIAAADNLHAVPRSLQPFSWDTLLENSRNRQLLASNNNGWAIENTIYTVDFSDGDRGEIFPVPKQYNRELEDFHQLIRLLKAKGADASFVILPLNPYYYSNLDELDPVMQELASTLKKNAYPCLNFWVTQPKDFEKGVLNDVMHLSDYGWYRVDRFIADTYNLQAPRHEHP